LYYKDTTTGVYLNIDEPVPTITQYYTYDESTSTYSSYEGPISFNPNVHHDKKLQEREEDNEVG
jgi:hypothetical protein